jgi:hypothetical protein
MSVKPGSCMAILFTLATGVLLRLSFKLLPMNRWHSSCTPSGAVDTTSGGNMKRGNGDKKDKRETRSNDPKQEGLENLLYQVEIARGLLEHLELDPEVETPGRAVVRHIGESLVTAMEKARASGKPEEAEVVAAECVVHAETKDHSNWELIGLVAEKSKGDLRKVLREAYDEVEKDEDHHLYHTKGWARELSIQALGLPAVLPPPEEEKNVETAIGAARAQNARGEML